MLHVPHAYIANATANLLKDEIKVTFTLDLNADNLALCKKLSVMAEMEQSCSLSIDFFGGQLELPLDQPQQDEPETVDDDTIPEPTDSEVLDAMIDAEPQPEPDPATLF